MTATYDRMPASSHRASLGARRFGYAVSIVVNAMMLYAAYHVLEWGIRFFTSDWVDVLWAVRLSLGATIAANIAYLFFDYRPFQRVVQVALNALALLSIYVLYTVFPFDITPRIAEQALRIALLAGMLGLVVASIVEVVQLVTGRHD